MARRVEADAQVLLRLESGEGCADSDRLCDCRALGLAPWASGVLTPQPARLVQDRNFLHPIANSSAVIHLLAPV